MIEPMTLTMTQKFEIERMGRAIDATNDPQALRGLAKQLLQAWMSQKAATAWAMRDALTRPSRYTNLIPSQETLDHLQQEDAQRQHDPDQPQGEENPAR